MGAINTYPDDTTSAADDKYLTLDNAGTTKLTAASVLKAYILAAGNGVTAFLADLSVTSAKIAADAVTDEKLVNGKILKRQGGNINNWGASGGNNYDVSASNVKIQTGTIATNAGADVTITFGTAFTNTPVFVCSVSGGNAGDSAITANCFAEAVQVTTTTATIRTFNTGGGQSNQAVGWIAIGI